ncbi:hypothetical protein RHSIM_RhsimUnG0149100 [Rhododendron simsii]|uniref:SWIM-type domain-containing protein n=1 Tax=Rhododendron simsii TaxID=118357 RepID=A0A834FV02_RHOSS|nr:hypothetical protein RHSIM_RhsimUnG0149100 [Rhododendron simsii]
MPLPAYFDFIINHKGKVARLSNIDPDKYCYFDLFADVSEKLLYHYPAGLGLAILIFCELPGIEYRIDLNSDKSLIDVFHLDGVVDATQDGHVYGYNDEDDDWNLDREGEVKSDDGGRLMVEISGVDDGELSDYQSGDDEGNMSSGSDEGTEHGTGFDTSYNGKEPYVDCEGEVVLEEKMIFANVDAFRAKLRDYTVEKGFKIVRDKNEKARVTAHCDVKGCPWRIHASPLPDGITYQIKRYTPEHTCTRVNHNEDANSTWIAKKLLKDFKENPQLDLDGMQEKLNGRFGIESSKIQLYRAKRKCMDELEGSHGGQYKLLPTYAVEGWMGVTLRVLMGGVLISAVALDGNNGLFPLAVAVVESENNQSWNFFLEHIQTIIRASGQNRPWTIMSDQQKGLDGVVAHLLPEASHRNCARQLFNNFKAKYPGLALRKQFWIAARAYNQRKFNGAMAAIKELNTEAHGYLVKLPVSSWARHAFDDRVRSDHITNNGAESFNNWLGNLRGNPILTMLEGIRCKVMSRIQTRHQKGVAWTHRITANVKKLLIKVGKEARQCKAEYCGGTEYDVMDNGVRHLVDLGSLECVCRRWEISGIPCKHAMAAIMKDRKNVEDFVHSYYSKEMYLRAHGSMIHPILDHSMWTIIPGDPLDPPPLRRSAGPVRGRGGPSKRGKGNNRRGSTSGNEVGETHTINIGNGSGTTRGINRGRGSKGRGTSRGRGRNTTTTPQGNQVGTSQTQPSQCVTQSHPSEWSLF